MGLIVVIFSTYGCGFNIAAVYEEMMYFLEEGFVAWMLFGWIIPLFRAIDWPLDLYRALVG